MEELLRKLQKELDILADGFPEAELSLHVKYGKNVSRYYGRPVILRMRKRGT